MGAHTALLNVIAAFQVNVTVSNCLPKFFSCPFPYSEEMPWHQEKRGARGILAPGKPTESESEGRRRKWNCYRNAAMYCCSILVSQFNLFYDQQLK